MSTVAGPLPIGAPIVRSATDHGPDLLGPIAPCVTRPSPPIAQPTSTGPAAGTTPGISTPQPSPTLAGVPGSSAIPRACGIDPVAAPQTSRVGAVRSRIRLWVHQVLSPLLRLSEGRIRGLRTWSREPGSGLVFTRKWCQARLCIDRQQRDTTITCEKSRASAFHG